MRTARASRVRKSKRRYRFGREMCAPAIFSLGLALCWLSGDKVAAFAPFSNKRQCRSLNFDRVRRNFDFAEDRLEVDHSGGGDAVTEIADHPSRSQDELSEEEFPIMLWCFAISSLMLPLVLGSREAWAVDHPVDFLHLSIPSLTPDADPRYFLAGGLCAAASHGVTTPST